MDGSIKTGIRFDGWKGAGHTYIRPTGVGLNSMQYNEHVCLKEKIPADIQKYDMAVHIDQSTIYDVVVDIIKKCNVDIVRRCVDITELDGDVIVDCTGFQKQIISKVKDNNFIDYTNKILNNKALVFKSEYTNYCSQFKPYTISTAMPDNGWHWTIPLKSSVGFGYVYSDSFKNNSEEFINYICQYLDINSSDINLREVNFTTGRLKEHAITRNDRLYVSIGLSSGFIEPLEATGILLTVRELESLRELIDEKITTTQHNKWYNSLFDSMIDFIILHYKYKETNNDYWTHFKYLNVNREKYVNLEDNFSWDWVYNKLEENEISTTLNIEQLKNIIKAGKYTKWLELFK